MKYLVLMMGLLFLSSCGRLDRWWAGVAGHSTVCVDGVEYLQFPSGVTVKFKPNGTVSVCD